MYKVSIENNLVTVQCNLARSKHSLMNVIPARYSTGSPLTFTNADLVDPLLTEKDVDLTRARAITIAGETYTYAIYYPCMVNLAIGNIVLGQQEIWLTFDRTAWDSVVGMDILSQITRLHLEESDEELFFASKEEMIKHLVNSK